MDLKTFVAQSLTQILQGIKEAQSAPGGQHVAADGYISPDGNLMSGGTSGFFTKVDFDVLVLAETKDGVPSVKVGDVEAVQSSTQTAQNASRVKFCVHVRLPKGGEVVEPRSIGRHTYDYDPMASAEDM